MILLLLLLMQGCQWVDTQPTYRIAFSQCVGSDAWRQTMLEEMRRQLSFYPNIEFIYRDANNSSQKQIEQLRELRSLNPDLIIVSPNEAEPLTPIVDEIFRSGTPVIVTDRKTSSGLYHAYVGADNYEIGFMAGQYLANQLNQRGTISEVTGLPGSSAAIERQKGFHDALTAYPGIRLRHKINGQWLIDVARSRVATNATELAASDAIFAYNDQMALGTYQALQQALPANDVKIVGVDALPGAHNGLHFVAEKILHASMLYPTGGKECIQTAVAILHNQPYQRENILGTLVVDATNVELMRLQSDKIIKQQEDIDKQQQLFAEQQQIFSNQQRVLNILVVSLVLAVVFAGVSFYSLKANWEKNKQLEQQNHEILGQQQQILQMTKAIEQATEAKINFFTNISHEFKTPLSLMLLPLDDLLRRDKLPGDVHHALTLIKKNALTLQHLVSQLIDLRRVGYESLRIKAKAQSMLLFCNQVIQSFRPLARQRAINLRLENDAATNTLWFDETLMEKLLYNLLSNAFKYTAQHGEIVLRLTADAADDGWFTLEVTDTGTGISEADLPHLFEPFYQGDNHTQGSGIGLAICKEIASLHHGRIAVSSERHSGTTVTVSLPKGDRHLAADEKMDASADAPLAVNDSRVVLQVLENDANTAIGDEADNVPTLQPLKTHTVLIVEDHQEMRQFLAEKLAERYNVFTACNAHEGLSQAYTQLPDLIISDVLMPGGPGTTLLTKLKADARTACIPVVLLTARGSEAQVREGLDALADAYLTKPFRMDYLLTVVGNLIDNRQLLRKYFSSELAELLPAAHVFPADKRFINELAAVVEENIPNCALNVDYLCEQLATSRVQLYRKVKSLLGCSINDYISERRLKKAKFLLQQDLPISDVAYETGFSSPAYFSTAFKNKYGMSPSLFKKRLTERN